MVLLFLLQNLELEPLFSISGAAVEHHYYNEKLDFCEGEFSNMYVFVCGAVGRRSFEFGSALSPVLCCVVCAPNCFSCEWQEMAAAAFSSSSFSLLSPHPPPFSSCLSSTSPLPPQPLPLTLPHLSSYLPWNTNTLIRRRTLTLSSLPPLSPDPTPSTPSFACICLLLPNGGSRSLTAAGWQESGKITVETDRPPLLFF